MQGGVWPAKHASHTGSYIIYLLALLLPVNMHRTRADILTSEVSWGSTLRLRGGGMDATAAAVSALMVSSGLILGSGSSYIMKQCTSIRIHVYIYTSQSSRLNTYRTPPPASILKNLHFTLNFCLQADLPNKRAWEQGNYFLDSQGLVTVYNF